MKVERANQGIPEQLGPYRVLKEVGAGGLGRVFKAIDERNGRTVAVKILHDDLVKQSRFLGAFHRELLIMSGLHHQYIVSYVDSYFQPPLCYVVTDYVDGVSGYVLARKTARIPPIVALCIIVDILQGLDYLHLHDLVHSDMSAANYMIDAEGRVYIMDFGLSCQSEIEDYKDYMMGTPGYSSPEHVSENPLGRYSDIYCATLILFELIAGKSAVAPSKNRFETLASMKKIDFRMIRSSERRIERSLVRLIKHGLQFNYKKRWQSAEPMLVECLEILTSCGVRYTRYVIAQFMADRGLIKNAPRPIDCDIYTGCL